MNPYEDVAEALRLIPNPTIRYEDEDIWTGLDEYPIGDGWHTVTFMIIEGRTITGGNLRVEVRCPNTTTECPT